MPMTENPHRYRAPVENQPGLCGRGQMESLIIK